MVNGLALLKLNGLTINSFIRDQKSAAAAECGCGRPLGNDQNERLVSHLLEGGNTSVLRQASGLAVARKLKGAVAF